MESLTRNFEKFSRHVERWTGSAWAFFAACAVVLVWACTGPFFGWSTGHSLFINTLTTIVTFLMVFSLQGNQSRDTEAVHVKLNELLAAIEGARTSLAGAEDMDRKQLDALRAELREKGKEAEG